jgi:hypothetical protein
VVVAVIYTAFTMLRSALRPTISLPSAATAKAKLY